MATNANTQLLDNAIHRAAMVRRYEDRVQGKVELILDGHKVRLDKLVNEANLSRKGLLKFREAVDQELLRTYREVFVSSKKNLLELAADQVSYAYQNIEAVFGEIWRTARPKRRIPEEIVLKRPLYKDQTLERGWSGIRAGERQRIELTIRRGLAEGKSQAKIAQEIRKGKIHRISRNQSNALVTTAVTSVKSQADQAVYEANKNAIIGWQYVAVLDSRTTPICTHRDGEIYDPDDTVHLPPAHYRCRSTTVPVFKSWEDIYHLEGAAQVRKRNIGKLSKRQVAFYDGQLPLQETYHQWLSRQPVETQFKHLGTASRVELFRKGHLNAKMFTKPTGKPIGIQELRKMTDEEYGLQGQTKKFALAKEKLDSMKLGAATPDDFIDNKELTNTLRDYYKLQTHELDGTLSLVNYRGVLIHVKKANKNRVINSPPTHDQMVFNPVTGRYDDARIYQPNPGVLTNSLRLIDESQDLKKRDKDYITKFIQSLDQEMGMNERAAVAENLRILFTNSRKKGQVWGNFKSVANAQMKFDVMNVSDAIETQLRKDRDLLGRLKQSNYIDPVLGPTQLRELSEDLIDNIKKRNKWEDRSAPMYARRLRLATEWRIPPHMLARMTKQDLQKFYLKFVHRLALADFPDRDQFAVNLGRDLYNAANLNGSRNQWFKLGRRLLEADSSHKFFKIDTYGAQKRRMRSRMSGQYFGPYYDTMSYNIVITDPKLQVYSKLTRKIEVGMRIGVTKSKNRLIFKKGRKTYFIKTGFGDIDTRIPITSTTSYKHFPEDFIDGNMVDALNWAAKAEYKIDEDFYDFVNNLLHFRDDKGKAAYFDSLNELKHYLVGRGDSYERFKAMEWLRNSDSSFSNHPFIDHRARIYDRGLIGPQSGETFRPFLNTAQVKELGDVGYAHFRDQVGAFLGGLNDNFEGRYDALTFLGRRAIERRWRKELVSIGNHMLRNKPNDIRKVLENPLVRSIEGEEIPKFLRFAIETAKIDNYLGGNYSKKSLEKLRKYKTGLALEQDASSSGAQIIALTTKNKQLAELSNVIPTTQKKRLYDEIAAATFNDPRFRKLNQKLGLTEKELRKASKAQNMVTFYGAGERTGILNVERKLAKILEKDDVLVVRASDRDTVLSEISARMARYQKFDPETYEELSALRKNIKDIFDKGLNPGDDIMEELYFLDPKTKDLVAKMTESYSKVVTPEDFKMIAKIMSEHLAEQVPILKSFTKYFGRLAEDYLINAKPKKAAFDWVSIAKINARGEAKPGKRKTLPKLLSEFLGVKANEPITDKLVKRFTDWNPKAGLYELMFGVEAPKHRRTGQVYFKIEPIDHIKIDKGYELFYAHKMPKAWNDVPWVNFDGKVLEQHFTQTFEERLAYKDKFGTWTNNILQVPQKTEVNWWDVLWNAEGKINDISDVTKARTAFAVNGNHSNDAVLVKKYHQWGRRNKIYTSTIHDAFFANIADLDSSKNALRGIYADALDGNTVVRTLEEMRDRGLPWHIYRAYFKEAVELGIIPRAGVSKIDGKLVKHSDILSKKDILRDVPEAFQDNFGWYGIGP